MTKIYEIFFHPACQQSKTSGSTEDREPCSEITNKTSWFTKIIQPDTNPKRKIGILKKQLHKIIDICGVVLVQQ